MVSGLQHIVRPSPNPSNSARALLLPLLLLSWPTHANDRASNSSGFRQPMLQLIQDVGPPAPAAAGASLEGAGAPTVSPSILDTSDFAASQRLRFDVGDRVFFSPGSAELGSRARLVLSRQAHWLNAWNATIVIVGHADEGGAAGNDDRIALKRAEAVRDRLVEEGIPPDRVRVVGMGRRDPVADCREPVCGAQNRRAVVHVMNVRTGGVQR